jgi:hypothetical protein
VCRFGAISYRFVATSAAFSSTLVTATVPEGVNDTGFIPAADLPINAPLFWRATARDAANSVSSAPTRRSTSRRRSPSI